MDIRRNEDGMVWFQASRVWGKDRMVLYGDSTWLVPLLPSEVPFGYDDIGVEVVFLWDQATGIALATSRRAAWAPWSSVKSGLSRMALFGESGDPPGFCYDLMTAGDRSLGPFPSVSELQAAGVEDEPAGCSFEAQGQEMFHCVPGDSGVPMSDLGPHCIVGASMTVAGFVAVGVVAAAVAVVSAGPVFDRLAVAGAAPVDLSVAVQVPCDDSSVPEFSVRWMGSRVLSDGLKLNIGMVARDPVSVLPARFAVGLSDDITKLYWMEGHGGQHRTVAQCASRGRVVVNTSEALTGLFVYAVTEESAGSPVYQPVKAVGRAGCFCECDACASFLPQGYCYSRLVAGLTDLGYEAKWRDVIRANLVDADSMDRWRVVKVEPGLWHVTTGKGLRPSKLVEKLKYASGIGIGAISYEGEMIHLDDRVGAVSRMASQLVDSLVTLKDIRPDKLDELGAGSAGTAIALMDARTKEKARVLQAVGDNVMSLVLSLRILDRGGTAQEYQELRSRSSSNSYLTERFVGSRYVDSFTGVGPSISAKTGGSAVEAMLAVVYRAAGLEAAVELMEQMGI